MYIDTHAHLNFKTFDKDCREVIRRAFKAGVKGVINVGSNLETSKKAIEIAKTLSHSQECESVSKVWAAVGLHPIHVADEQFDFNQYLEIAKDPKVVAIGETGIDLYHNKKTIDLQRDLFEKSLKIANQLNKPVILHCREGQEDLRAWLRRQQVLPKGVIHCFSGDLELAKFVLDLGFLISFTGVITFTKNQKTLRVIREIPLEKIMIETDCPFLTPQKYRGQRNEPVYVVEVAKKIAEIKKLPLEKVKEITTKNAVGLFNLDFSK